MVIQITQKMVKKRATKLAISLKNLSHQEHLIQLKLPTLKYRRLRGDVIEVFKILNKIYDTSLVPNLHFDKSFVIRGNKFKLIKDRSSHDIRKYYFTVRITPIWNSLPNWVVDVDNINTFNTRRGKFWSNQEVCMILRWILLETETDHSVT